MHFRGDWNDYNSGSLMQKKERKKPSDITVANKTDAVWSEPCWKHVLFFFNWKVYLFNPRVLHRGTFHVVVSL